VKKQTDGGRGCHSTGRPEARADAGAPSRLDEAQPGGLPVAALPDDAHQGAQGAERSPEEGRPHERVRGAQLPRQG